MEAAARGGQETSILSKLQTEVVLEATTEGVLRLRIEGCTDALRSKVDHILKSTFALLRADDDVTKLRGKYESCRRAVLEADDEPVVAAILAEHGEESVIEVQLFAVAKGLKGKGFGTAAADGIADAASKAGAVALLVQSMQEAVAFWKARGFEQTVGAAEAAKRGASMVRTLQQRARYHVQPGTRPMVKWLGVDGSESGLALSAATGEEQNEVLRDPAARRSRRPVPEKAHPFPVCIDPSLWSGQVAQEVGDLR